VAKRMKIDPYCRRQKNAKNVAHDSSFRQCKAYADVHGGSSGQRCQMTVGLSTTAIFGDLGGYFFGKVRQPKNFRLLQQLGCAPSTSSNTPMHTIKDFIYLLKETV